MSARLRGGTREALTEKRHLAGRGRAEGEAAASPHGRGDELWPPLRWHRCFTLCADGGGLWSLPFHGPCLPPCHTVWMVGVPGYLSLPPGD